MVLQALLQGLAQWPKGLEVLPGGLKAWPKEIRTDKKTLCIPRDIPIVRCPKGNNLPCADSKTRK